MKSTKSSVVIRNGLLNFVRSIVRDQL